jgi:hypothetical protein
VKFEYTTQIGTYEATNEFIAKLNVHGEEGWEAVGMTAEKEGYTVLLKRDKKPDPGPVTW